MMLLKTALELLIRSLRADSSYRIDSNYSGFELLVVFYYRGLQLIRGFRFKIFIKSSGLLFCGRQVTIEHGYNIYSGPSLILEDGVNINALSVDGIRLGRNVSIGKNTIIVCTGVVSNKGVGLKVGNNVGIGSQSFISCQGGVNIGSDVIIGPGFKVFSENHNFDRCDMPIRLQGVSRKGVVIMNNCWIGSNVTILDGVTIGEGCVIAAGALVTKTIPSNSIAAGIPSRVIKSRISAINLSDFNSIL